MKEILVNGDGGFIGGHLVKRLKAEGHWVRAVDIKPHDFAAPPADEFALGGLRDPPLMQRVSEGVDEVYQLAADVGGAGYILTGKHDAAVMHNSATINLNTLELGRRAGIERFFYSSSACIYPEYNRRDPDNPKCSEEAAHPAAPDRPLREGLAKTYAWIAKRVEAAKPAAAAVNDGVSANGWAASGEGLKR